MSRPRKVLSTGKWIIPFGITCAVFAQQGEPRPAPAAGQRFAATVALAPLFFREEWRQTGAFDTSSNFIAQVPVTAAALTNKNLELAVYDPGAKNIPEYAKNPPPNSVARDWKGPSCVLLSGYNQNPPPPQVGGGQPSDPPNVWTGVCATPVVVTLKDKGNFVDLTGLSKIRWLTRVSGFHVVRPVVKLADGTWLVGDYAEGGPSTNSTVFLESEFAIATVRWLRLDIGRVVTRGTWVEKPDLSRVDEVGFADLLPGSGHGWGGFVNVGKMEVYGKPVRR
jgi:hypothetical protein